MTFFFFPIKKKKKIARGCFDHPTLGLWAPRASSAPPSMFINSNRKNNFFLFQSSFSL
uniref:Uncharacterized protein n=1 Tax=viral metagenome TaxID=1070528 RepID=A0A6C0K1X4_9ZZZZ